MATHFKIAVNDADFIRATMIANFHIAINRRNITSVFPFSYVNIA
ncbi:hypothetical protein [Alteromonas macleodii]|nr:hypothetical protein [Alteromonas macleodii]